MKKNLRDAIWFLIALSGTIFTMTILMTIQGAPAWGWVVAIFLFCLQLTGLVICMHVDPQKTHHPFARFFRFMLKLSVLGVLAWLGLAVFSLASQYHNLVLPTELPEKNGNIAIETTDDLTIMYPEYTSVEFVSANRPSRLDEAVTYCSGATFQKTYNPFFTHDEIAAVHVEDGVLYRGYAQKGMGAFSFYDGAFHFSDSEYAEQDLTLAAERGGCGFQQYMIIDDGEIVLEPANEYRCFRVIADLDGKLCIIDSKKQIHFHDFACAVRDLGVTEALYMDMGSGWNYSWYRDNNGKVNTLIGIPWIFSHNWIEFRK